jgi:hypothetical protein
MKRRIIKGIILSVLCLVLLASLTSCAMGLSGTYKKGTDLAYETYRFSGNKFYYEVGALGVKVGGHEGTFKIKDGKITFIYDDSEHSYKFEKGKDYIIINGASYDKQ